MARNSARRSSRALFGKPSSTVLLLRCADDEPLTALRAPPLEDVAAGLGGVALAEPVLLVPPDLARLVRALHDDCLLGAKSAARKHARSGVSTTASSDQPRSARSTRRPFLEKNPLCALCAPWLIRRCFDLQ